MNDRSRPKAAPEPTTTTTTSMVAESSDIPACHCPRGDEVFVGGECVKRDVRDRRCHPDPLSDWASEGIRRHDERRKRAQAWMADPANAEAVAIIRAMLDGRRIP
jgi:hypothetical protein